MSGSEAKSEGGTAKKRLWTPANVVTVVRMVLVPVWLALAEAIPEETTGEFSVYTFIVCMVLVVLCATDKLDGYLARSRNEVTTFGKFLDPIADKLVVVVALCFLLERGWVSSWVLLIVVAREFIVSGLRMVVAAEGVVIAASNLGKAKTATTMVGICGLMLCMSLSEGTFLDVMLVFSYVLLGIGVVLTIISGVDYVVKSWPTISKTE